MRLFGYGFLLVAVATVCLTRASAGSLKQTPTPPSAEKDPGTFFDKGDPDMAAAIAKARATLPKFWKHLKHPGPNEDNFALKIPIRDGDKTEDFWLGNLEWHGNDLYGYIDNDPEVVHNVKLGERLKIEKAHIYDWMYSRNNKIVGNYTIRALFKNMSTDEVKQMKAQLADP